MKSTGPRFNKLMKFVKIKNSQEKDKNVAEFQSPQAPDIKPPSPEKEAELVHRFRTTLAKKKGKSLLYETT